VFIFSRDKQGSEARNYQEKPLRIFKVILKKITAQTMNYLREANIVVVSLILASEPCLPIILCQHYLFLQLLAQ
jgi:hypothetical protein